MAYVTTNAHRTAGISLGEGVRNLLASLKTAWARSATYKQTYAELNSLTDRELNDIGISRCMIHGIAKQEADRV